MLEILNTYIGRFMTLPADELYVLSQLAEVRSFDKRVKLVQEGEQETYINFIATGLARKYFYNGQSEVITQIAKEGELISASVSFLAGSPSRYIVETIEPTTFISFSRDSVDHLYRSSRHFEKLGRLIISELFLQKEYWELNRIRYSTRERFVRFMQENPDLLQRVSQKHLASYLNIQPETFSRLKHHLRTSSAGNIARNKIS